MNIFETINTKKVKSNAFDLSHEVKLSCNMGELIPVYLEEIVPGDKFRVSSEVFLRTMPLIAPLMHRVNVYVHFFFVPNRLLWENWENFITGGEDGLNASVMPKVGVGEVTRSQFNTGTLADYLGLPNNIAGGTIPSLTEFSALPFRAYQTIYNEYYRDQNLETKIGTKKTDTVDSAEQIALTTLRLRAYEKDYFTSCLPWAQRGNSVTIPTTSSFVPQYSSYSVVKPFDGGADPTPGSTIRTSGDVNDSIVSTRSAADVKVRIENLTDPQIVPGTAVTINELRVAVRLQEWLEKNARAGARYIEQILAHFGVRSSDARLQRPEYLGGGKQAVSISEVLATAQDATTKLGTMAGHGLSVGKSNSFTKTFEEHGYVIGILSVVPRTAYQQGTPKTFKRFTKTDFFFPEFAHLGEQAVTVGELFTDYINVTNNTLTFGYQSRYAEYKYNNSRVAGEFQTTLNYWHLGRKFASAPALNNTFIKANPVDMQRIWPVADATDKLLIQIYNDVQAVRPMPIFGTPTL
jgi:hypothetical protein